jgi:hypothetical protein
MRRARTAPLAGKRPAIDCRRSPSFARDALGKYATFDGRLWRTLVPLIARPGFLTREYLAGRRRRYIRPARLFLVSSLVLFAVLRIASQSLEMSDTLDMHGTAPHAPVAEQGTGVRVDDSLNIDAGSLPSSLSPLQKRIDRFNTLTRTQKGERIVAGILQYGPYAMFALLPAFAGLLKIVYLGRGKRHPGRPRLYAEHLVFAAHSHAFLFIVGTLLVFSEARVVHNALLLWAAFYLARSMRVVYRGTWIGIALRGIVLAVTYLVLFGFATAALVVAAILLR